MIRQRSSKEILRVTFPDGTVLCNGNGSTTFVWVLQKIGLQALQSISLVYEHKPLISDKVYSGYETRTKPISDGWNVIVPGDADSKYMQLVAVNEKLSLGLNIQKGQFDDATPAVVLPPVVEVLKAKKTRLSVTFPSGERIENYSSKETFLAVIKKFGVDTILRKELEYLGKKIVSYSQCYKEQVQDGSKWIFVPTRTVDQYKALTIIAIHCKQNISLSIINN